MFSKACEYGIRASLYIAHQSLKGIKLSIPEIAQAIDSPVSFTGKILQQLVRDKIISSSKGPNGGFYISPDSKPITLSEIVESIDGMQVMHSCSLGLKECSDKNPCPIHEDIKIYKEKLRATFQKRTIQHLSKDIDSGNSFLKISRSKTK